MTASESWREDGLCTQIGPELFFAEDEESVASAKAVCTACESLAPCTVYALANATGHGVQAAMTGEERLAHPGHRKVLPLSAYLPDTDEKVAERWEAERRRLERRARAEAERRSRDNLDNLIHPLDRKAGR